MLCQSRSEVTLLGEYGAHTICRCIDLKDGLFVEVWVG